MNSPQISMEKCKLKIKIDKTRKYYRVGDEICGTVYMELLDSCKCDKLTITFYWDTRGKGEYSSGKEVGVTLFSGKLKAGVHQFEFRYKIPDGPSTFRGKIFGVRWNAVARAYLPWRIDPKYVTRFTVFGGPRETHINESKEDFEERYLGNGERIEKQTPTLKVLGMLMSSIAFLALIAFTLIAFTLYFKGFEFFISEIQDIYQGKFRLGKGLYISIMFVLFTMIFILIYLIYRNKKIVMRLLGKPELKVAPNLIRADDPVVFDLKFTPTKDINVDNITVWLKGAESVIENPYNNFSDTNTYSSRNTISDLFHDKKVELKWPHLCRRKTSCHYQKELFLPKDAPVSFSYEYKYVSWSIYIEINFDQGQKWVDSQSVYVLPAARRINS